MEELTAKRKELEKDLQQARKENQLPSPEAVREWLLSFRDGDIESREYQKKLISVFVKAVYVYDDRIRVLFNYGKESSRTDDVFVESSPSSTSGVSRELFFARNCFGIQFPI